MTNEEKSKLFLGTIGFEGKKPVTNTLLMNIDLWDSIGKLFVMSMIKKEFGRDVSPAEIRACETVGDILALMEKEG